MNKVLNNISPSQANAWLSSGEAVLVDVREPDEFKAEHIGYAISMPLNVVHSMSVYLDLPKDRKIIFMCASGGRSEDACTLVDARYQEQTLYVLDGGIRAWKNAALPVLSSVSGGSMSIFRQVQIIVGVLVLSGVLIGFAGMRWGFTLSGIFGAALAFAGVTGRCGLARVLSRLPCNRVKPTSEV